MEANVKACNLCGSQEYFRRPGQVRDNPTLDILECHQCGLVFLSEDDHISDQHYVESGMHDGAPIDIDSWLKETEFDDQRRFEFVKSRITNTSLLDFGCGAGGFLERVKTHVSESAGVELEQALQTSYAKRELNVYTSLDQAVKRNKKWNVITSFHVIEHLTEPQKILSELANLLADSGEMIIEVPSANDALLTLYDCAPFQKFTYWSQHLFMYNENTLLMLAKQSGLKVKWIKHIQRYPLSNHLHWLSQSKPGGHQQWHFLDDEVLNAAYASKLASLGLTDTIIMGLGK